MEGYHHIKLILHGGNKIAATYILPISLTTKVEYYIEKDIFSSRGFTIHFFSQS